MSFEPKEIQEWKQELHSYNTVRKNADPNKYRNPNYNPPTTHVDMKQKEYNFDPILNRYRQKETDQNYNVRANSNPKAQRMVNRFAPYDIITLDKAPPEPNQSRKACSMDAHVQPYNIITNAVKIPNHKAFRVRMKKINEEVFRDYNIINNQYWKNNAEKSQKDWDKKKKGLEKLYSETHDFDPIRCNYYNEEKEQKFWEKESVKQKQMYELKNSRVPKSYKFREPINLNHEKNTFLSEGFEAFKNKEKAKMKRYQKKYDMEKHFRELGATIDDRNENLKMNKFYAQRFLEEYKEGVDPITLGSVEHTNENLKHALGNKREIIREKPRPKKKFRFLY